MHEKPTIYHIPVCPFSQRLEILLALKGEDRAAEFEVVDITRARDPVLLEKAGGSTALPILETADGRIIKESLVILDYLDASIGAKPIRRSDPYQHAVEQMLCAIEADLTMAGYLFLLNQQPDQRAAHEEKLLGEFAKIDAFLTEHNPDGVYLFDEFGLAEAVFTPIFMRFWFLDYYENFDLPATRRYDRVRRWRDACLNHPAATQVSREQIVKLYYDYAFGAGNGALLPDREKSSFVFEPPWKSRPWPPAKKYVSPASDAELGLL